MELHNSAQLLRFCATFPDQNCDQNYSKKPCTRRIIMYCLVYVMYVLDLFDVLLCIVCIPASHGIQEVSGSIPLIYTKRSLETLVFQGFL